MISPFLLVIEDKSSWVYWAINCWKLLKLLHTRCLFFMSKLGLGPLYLLTYFSWHSFWGLGTWCARLLSWMWVPPWSAFFLPCISLYLSLKFCCFCNCLLIVRSGIERHWVFLFVFWGTEFSCSFSFFQGHSSWWLSWGKRQLAWGDWVTRSFTFGCRYLELSCLWFRTCTLKRMWKLAKLKFKLLWQYLRGRIRLFDRSVSYLLTFRKAGS